MRNHQDPIFKFIKPHITFLFGAKCALCDKVSLSNHVHHIDNNSRNNNSFNFCILCNHHHKLAHKNKFVIRPTLNFYQSQHLEALNKFLELTTIKK